MATVTLTPAETVVTLELSEAEALYVLGCLGLCNPSNDQFGDDEDPVYIALSNALDRGDIYRWDDYAVVA